MSAIIKIEHIDYLIDDKKLFEDISLVINGHDKMAIIGRNGIGKTTLLNIIAGILTPSAGNVERNGSLFYCQQLAESVYVLTIAEFLDFEKSLAALARIEQGSTAEADYELIGDRWQVREELQQLLTEFGLAHHHANTVISQLSGGERTRLVLAQAFNSEADLLLLDEPTNNLDYTHRQWLYQKLSNWSKALLIVSHDRALLNQMNHIVELSSLGIKTYGGNFDFYQQQHEVEEDKLQQQLEDAKKYQAKTERSIQSTREKHDQRAAKGRQSRRDGSLDKLTLNSMQGRSERSQHRNRIQEGGLLGRSEQQLADIKSKIETVEQIKIALPATHVASRQLILVMENIGFAYGDKNIIEDFSFIIQGPQRIAIAGDNGSGKSTLIKLLLGELVGAGTAELKTSRVQYVDQNISMLDMNKTVCENFMAFNPEATEFEARSCLAQFLFRNRQADKRVSQLSGGEKLRACLACSLLSQNAPQLLILDEPTNHLDLASLQALESLLNCYEGALIVISHDQDFIAALDIHQQINMGLRPEVVLC